MRAQGTIHVGLLLVLCCPLAMRADDAPTKKVALLVGVNEYVKPGFKPLEFAEADVTAVGAELKKLGFEVTILLGSGKGEQKATLSNITAVAQEMVAPLGQKDVALVMLSGHGQQLDPNPDADPDRIDFDKTQSFYCPVDALVNRPETQFSLSHLVDDILAPNVGRKLLIVDACRDVPVDRTRGRNAKGIEGRVVALPEGTGVFFSCSAGQTSFERDELGHGLFTYCVLEGLRGKAVIDGVVEWDSLVAHVNRRMHQEELTRYMPARQRQVPIRAGSLPYTVLGKSVVRPMVPSAASIEFVKLRAGSFDMGAEYSHNSEPIHRVTMTKPFYAGKYEVTIGQTLKWLNSGAKINEAWITDEGEYAPVLQSGTKWVRNTASQYSKSDEHPMHSISWHGAKAFCTWCSQQDPNFTYRLPSEAEWEYMARAGSTTDYPWGDALNGREANVNGYSPHGTTEKGPYLETTTEVGSYPPNAWGLYDTIGNVWEWCEDEYDDEFYGTIAAQLPDPVNHRSPGSLHVVIRGGSWFRVPRLARSAYRFFSQPPERTTEIGFRVVAE